MLPRTRILAGTASSLLTLLGLGCGSSVEKQEGSGGTMDNGPGPVTGPGPTTGPGSGGAGDPDHPPTCDEAQTASVATVSAVAGTSVTGAGGSTGEGGFGGGEPATPRGPSACVDPEPIVFGCVDTGVDRCADGFLRRREAVACPHWERPEAESSCTDGSMGCILDSECPGAAENCRYTEGGPGSFGGCNCEAACATDADCGEQQLCLCGEGGGTCINATCQTDADCGEGLFCASLSGVCSFESESFRCQHPQDECGVDGDCFQICSMGGDVRRCDIATCEAVGRPLVVDGEARVAPAIASAAWAMPVAAELDSLGTSTRAALADHWLATAGMEHASVASFAAFALGLLAHGAPPALVRGAQSAMADEIAHAELSYGLASRFGGSPVGPGPLDLGRGVCPTSLSDLAIDTFLEGCVAEGLAAAEAALLTERAVDPVVRGILQRIANDEARHAELAWQTIAWALERDGSLGVRLERALVELESRARVAAPEEASLTIGALGEVGELDGHGVLSAPERAALRRDLLALVVRPVLGKLCARQVALATEAPPS